MLKSFPLQTYKTLIIYILTTTQLLKSFPFNKLNKNSHLPKTKLALKYFTL